MILQMQHYSLPMSSSLAPHRKSSHNTNQCKQAPGRDRPRRGAQHTIFPCPARPSPSNTKRIAGNDLGHRPFQQLIPSVFSHTYVCNLAWELTDGAGTLGTRLCPTRTQEQLPAAVLAQSALLVYMFVDPGTDGSNGKSSSVLLPTQADTSPGSACSVGFVHAS